LNKMQPAYLPAVMKLKEDLAKGKQRVLKLMEEMSGDVIVLQGKFDHVEQLLQTMDIECEPIYPSKLNSNVYLPPEKVMFVNCPGSGVSQNGQTKIRNFVGSGGWLVTSDWALGQLVEPIWGDIISEGSRNIPDDVVTVEPLEVPLVDGVVSGSQFWLEQRSSTIRIHNERVVIPMIISSELEQKYGSKFIMVGFSYGQGKVIHMVSHFSLQRSKTGETRLQDAYSSLAILSNILAHKKNANEKR